MMGSSLSDTLPKPTADRFPSRQVDEITRGALLSLLDQVVTDGRSAMLIGPPLSGKSTLLDQYGAQPGRSVIRANASNRWEPLASTELGDDLTTTLLVDDFDEFERLDPDKGSETLEKLIGRGYVVLAARRYPRHGLSRWRVSGRLVEVTPAMLALSQAEAAVLLGLGETVESVGLSTMMRRWQGWIAPFCALRRSASTPTELTEIAIGFDSTAPLMRDLLEEEVLRSLSQDQIDLLESISVFPIIDPEAISAVFEQGPERRLVDLARDLPLLSFEADRGGSYLLHPMLRAHVEARLKDRDAGRWKSLLKAAARVSENKGDGLGAAEIQFKLQDYTAAAACLGECADTAFGNLGATQRFFSLCQKLPPGFATNLDQSFWMARGAVVAGAFGHAARIIKYLETAGNPETSERFEVIRILVALGFADFDQLRQRGAAFLANYPAASPLDRAMIASALAIASNAVLDWKGNAKALAQARSECLLADAPYFSTWVALLEVVRNREMGHLRDATIELRKIVSGQGHGALRATLQLMLANLLALQGELDEAAELVERFFRGGARHGISETAYLAVEVGAKVKLHKEGLEPALRHVRECEGWVAAGFGERARYMTKVVQLELLLGQTDPHYSDMIGMLFDDLEAWKNSGTFRCPWFDEKIALLWARHWLREGDFKRATAIVDPIIAATRAQGRLLPWTDASMIKVAAYWMNDHADHATRALLSIIDVLTATGGEGLVVRHAHLVKPLAAALQSMATAGRRIDGDPAQTVIFNILRAMGSEIVAVETEDQPNQVLLTATELRILRLVEGGLRNAEIASRLHVTLQTVKWHMYNIFGKMGVKNRTSALVRARELLLL